MSGNLSVGFGQQNVASNQGPAAYSMKKIQLQKQISEIEEQNPNDPRLNNLRQQLELLEQKGQKMIENMGFWG